MATKSENPPAKSEGGNSSFVWAALAMLLIGGGLVYWKVHAAPASVPEPAPAPSLPATVEEPQGALEQAPPPPPSVAEPDAGPPSGSQRRVHDLPDPCKTPCNGRENASLIAALRGKGGQARSCYERALRTNSTLQGRMTLRVTVGATGEVCSAAVGTDGLGDPGVTNCVLGQFRAASFPPPQGGCVNTEVPLNFVPKKQ